MSLNPCRIHSEQELFVQVSQTGRYPVWAQVVWEWSEINRWEVRAFHTLPPVCEGSRKPWQFCWLSQLMSSVLLGPESVRRLSSPKCLLKTAFGPPAHVVRCCEPHLLLVKCFWRFIVFFKYKSAGYRFPVGELKVKQKSPLQAAVWRPENDQSSSLCKVKYRDLQEPRRSQARRST